MVRLNIETSIWADARFQRFLMLVGDRHRAIGMVVDLWALAQRFWIPQKQLIPLKEWNDAGLPDLLFKSGLAEKRTEGVYAKGTEKHFAWYFDGISQRRQAGINSAKRLRDSKGRLLPRLSQSPTDANETQRPLDFQPAESSESLREANDIQPSSSSSKSKRLVDPSDTTRLWSHYSEGITKKGINAVHEGAKTNRWCHSLAKKYGLDGAKALVDAYLCDGTHFVKDKAWSLGLLFSQQQNYLNKAKLKVPPKAMALEFGNEWGE